ncbi:RecBCD enzyme subunit RecC [Planctomycetes bacterium Pan216]|uniref:RecBCD enzyme subunit RecC n=1 Tax=Kolteria novifilia TaxID=2527975 RepID=A0A518B8W4_9BACT|nr:RecBCD enzyme subunit RecC [Planctomycetes bacterium Pan216]
MLHLFHAENLGSLVPTLIERLDQPGPNPLDRAFRMVTVLVPSRLVETYVTHEVARRRGIACNLRFVRPLSFLASLLRREDRSRRPLTATQLERGLWRLFDEADESYASLPGPVRDYLGEPGSPAREQRRQQLAEKVAGLLDTYMTQRPRLTEQWAEGKAVFTREPAHSTEAWQRELWRRLLGPEGLLPTIESETGIHWSHPADIVDRLSSTSLPRKLLWFGADITSPGERDSLARLAELTDVDAFAVIPSLRPPGVASWTRRWAEPPQRAFELLHPTCPTARIERVAVRPASPTSLLGQIQRDIVSGVEKSESQSLAGDASVRILRCPDLRREAEILGNEIWELLSAEPTANRPPLRFDDIAILVADSGSFSSYVAHFESAFRELHDIPLSVADLPIAEHLRLLDALKLIVELPQGRLTRSDLLAVLTHPCVLGHAPEADPHRWRHWCEFAGIYRGADGDSPIDAYVELDLFHWDQGLRRLGLGAWMLGEESGEQRAYRGGDAVSLPVDSHEDELTSLGQLIALARSLLADAHFANEQHLPLTEWSIFFEGMIGSYLKPEDDRDEFALGLARRSATSLAEIDIDRRPVPYEIAKRIFLGQLGARRGFRGRPLTDGVVVAPLRSASDIPFRVVFIAGLGEGTFPVRARRDPLDLTEWLPVEGELDARQRDRFTFWKRLMATSDRLVLSYIARDSQTGEELAPSPMVEDFLSLLGEGSLSEVDLDRLTVAHPLRRYDASYFETSPDRGPLPSHSPAARQEYQATLLRKELVAHLGPGWDIDGAMQRTLPRTVQEWLGLLPLAASSSSATPEPSPSALVRWVSEQREERPTLAVSLTTLRRFLESPLQTYARLILRLSADDESASDSGDDEPLETTILQRTSLLRRAFRGRLSRPMPEDPTSAELLAPLLEHDELAGRLPTGPFLATERASFLSDLQHWKANVAALELDKHRPFRIFRFGRAEAGAEVDEVLPPLTFPLEVRVGDALVGVTVELHGRSELANPDTGESLILLASESTGSLKHSLRGHLDQILFTLSGMRGGAGYRSFVIPAGSRKHDAGIDDWPAISVEEAREYLRLLLVDLLEGTHDYRLPIEAVERHFRADGRKTIFEIVKELHDQHDRGGYSCLRGPLRDVDRFAAPPEEMALAMIERRFRWLPDAEQTNLKG